ncbi:MAG TPA: tetratricopeptide repeat protein [Kofleriaceae bacterium]|nr:tetratricopeptide repeat protein [Kofleriaceae bacterium]
MRAALIALALLSVTAKAAPGDEPPRPRSTPSDDLDKAREAYRNGQYGIALPLFNALLYPPPPRLASPRELTDAYVALGVCRFETGDVIGAKREFEQALALDPGSTIDPLIVSDGAVRQAFIETKLDMRARERAEAEVKHRAELRQLRNGMVGVEPHSLVVALLPFGLGQFQNNQTLKGTVFAASEGVTFVTSLGVWYYLVNEYGVRSTHVPLEDGPTVRHLQQIEIGGGIAFLGLWLWGAIDAYRHYKPSTQVELDESLLPPELRDLDKPKKKPAPPKPTSLLEHIVPIVTQSGVGIGLGWEN